jgi:alanine racemase
MDQLMLDVTGIEAPKLGDEVIFTGKQENEFISISEIANWSSTINYESSCTIGSMNSRVYKQVP